MVARTLAIEKTNKEEIDSNFLTSPIQVNSVTTGHETNRNSLTKAQTHRELQMSASTTTSSLKMSLMSLIKQTRLSACWKRHAYTFLIHTGFAINISLKRTKSYQLMAKTLISK